MNAQEKAAFAAVESEPAESRRAAATLHELRTRLDAAQSRLTDIRRERDAAAYDSVSAPPSSPAGRHMARLRRDAADAQQEAEDLEAAIATAKEKLETARDRARGTEAVASARHAIDVAEQLRDKGDECAELLVTFANRYREFAALSEELHRLGFAPTPRLMHLAAERALSSALQPTRLSPAPGLLPPGQRTSLDVVGRTYADQAIVQAGRVVNGGAA